MEIFCRWYSMGSNLSETGLILGQSLEAPCHSLLLWDCGKVQEVPGGEEGCQGAFSVLPLSPLLPEGPGISALQSFFSWKDVCFLPPPSLDPEP